MTSILSPSLLIQYDAADFAQRLFQHNLSADVAASATDFANLLTNVGRSTDAGNTQLQNYFEDLNATRTQEYGATYGTTGAAARSTANTILIGYG